MAIEERPSAATKRGRRSLLAGVVAVALLGGLTTVGIQTTAGATIIGPKIEICKGGPVSGSFQFSVDNSTTPVSVAVGTCKGVSVTAGTHTVKELASTTTTLSKIQIYIGTGTTNLATRTATVVVPETTNGEAGVRFVNQPATGSLKVCKVAGDPSILGNSYSFTESAGGVTVGPFAVTAGTLNPLNCSDITGYQIGTAVNVAELANPSTVVSNITVTGGGQSNTNLSAGTVTATVTSALTQVIYVDIPVVTQNPGGLEVCKNAGDPYVAAGPWNFSIAPYGQRCRPTGSACSRVSAAATSPWLQASTPSPSRSAHRTS